MLKSLAMNRLDRELNPSPPQRWANALTVTPQMRVVILVNIFLRIGTIFAIAKDIGCKELQN